MSLAFLGMFLGGCGVGGTNQNAGAPDDLSAQPSNLIAILSVFPNSGPLAGGTVVTVSGDNLINITEATMAGRPLQNLNSLNGRTLTGTVPFGTTAGPTDVSVRSSTNGSFNLVGGYIYNPSMVIESVFPSSGSFFGGEILTIRGHNFFGVDTVTLGGQLLSNFTVSGGEVIQGTIVQALTGGATDLVINSSSHGIVILQGAFTFTTGALIHSVTPMTGPQSGATNVIIVGDGFTGITRVSFGPFDMSGLTLVDSTTIRGQTPPGLAAGTVDVVAHFANGSTTTLAGGFSYNPAMTISAISPATGPPSGMTSVVITGTNFRGVTSVLIGTTPILSPAVLNENTITGLTPLVTGPGARDIIVNSSTHGTAVRQNGFTYTVPPVTVSQIVPSSGPQGGGTAVTLTGTNFVNVSEVRIGTTPLASFSVVNPTSITGTTGASPSSGLSNVVVVSLTNSTGTLTNGFTLNPTPVISIVDPNVGTPSGSTPVTLTGSDFASVLSVTFGGSPLTDLVVLNSTTLTGKAPAHAPGFVDVAVISSTNGTGTLTSGYNFAYFEPTVNVSLGATTMPSAIRAGDFDRDGKVDLVVTDVLGGILLIKGDGGGGFGTPQPFATGTSPQDLVTADFNLLGTLDLVVANQTSQTLSILRGNGIGGFTALTPVNVSGSPVGLAAGDMDMEGATDVVAVDTSGNVRVFLQDMMGDFNLNATVNAGFTTFRPVIVDIDRDGILDVMVGASEGVTLSTFLGDGMGNLIPDAKTMISHNLRGLAQGDLDRDGIPDLIAVGDTRASAVYGLSNGSFGTQLATTVGDGTRGVVVGDFDADGKVDYAVSGFTDSVVSLVRGLGNRTFDVALNTPVGSGPVDLIAADFDADGFLDLAALDSTSQEVSILMATALPSSGTFTNPTCFTTDLGPVDLVGGDFDRDGIDDVVTANQNGVSFTLLRGEPGGGLQTGVTVNVTDSPADVATGDFDNDGNPDLVLAIQSGRISVVLGNGDGSFQAQALITTSGTSSTHVAVGDLDRNGTADIVLAHPTSDVIEVILGVGNGTFNLASTVSAGADPAGLALADLDRDGDLDVIAAIRTENAVRVFKNNGSGNLTAQTPVSLFPQVGPTDLALGDLDQDGILDVAVVNPIANTLSILLGNGDGTFGAPQTLVGNSGMDGVEIVDVNRDGNLDVVATSTAPAVAGLLVFEGNGTGTFGAPQVIPTSGNPSDVAALDLNQDGVIDLLVSDEITAQVCVILGKP